MSGRALRYRVISVTILVFVAELHASGLCDWDERTFTTENGEHTFLTHVIRNYADGYIGANAFAYEDETDCLLGTTIFLCPLVYVKGLKATNITVPYLTEVNSITLDSTFPATIHRIEKYVQNKTVQDRFIVDENMQLSQCPRNKQTTLMWKFPGPVRSRTDFECFRNGTILCTGVSTGNEPGKCDVEIEGAYLIHTQVVNASKNDIEYFYCYLDRAIPRVVQTYNVDWRNSMEMPPSAFSIKVTSTVGKHLTATPLASFMALFAAVAASC